MRSYWLMPMEVMNNMTLSASCMSISAKHPSMLCALKCFNVKMVGDDKLHAKSKIDLTCCCHTGKPSCHMIVALITVLPSTRGHEVQHTAVQVHVILIRAGSNRETLNLWSIRSLPPQSLTDLIQDSVKEAFEEQNDVQDFAYHSLNSDDNDSMSKIMNCFLV